MINKQLSFAIEKNPIWNDQTLVNFTCPTPSPTMHVLVCQLNLFRVTTQHDTSDFDKTAETNDQS